MVFFASLETNKLSKDSESHSVNGNGRAGVECYRNKKTVTGNTETKIIYLPSRGKRRGKAEVCLSLK